MMNENLKNLDDSDMETLALNLAKKAEKINEDIGIRSNPDQDTTSAGLGMAAFFGGGTLGAMFSSAIGAAVPTLATVFAGPAVAAALTGVALFILSSALFGFICFVLFLNVIGTLWTSQFFQTTLTFNHILCFVC